MAIYSRRNQYRGVNAHLHSVLLDEFAGWEGFHGHCIVHLAEALNDALPEGYLVDHERSLQIRSYDPITGQPLPARLTSLRADVLISSRLSQTESAPSLSAALPVITVPLAETLDLSGEAYLRAVVIRRLEAEGRIGRPVVWIEILSPTNKPDGPGYLQYIQKRADVLHSGIVFAEIDYVHEKPATLSVLPDYTKGEPGAYPYIIAVSDPRPTITEGKAHIYGFRVDDPIPAINLPLEGQDTVRVDFGVIYNRTYESLRVYGHLVDYEQFPVHFDRYDPVDQARIRARMEAVAEAQRRGLDLESGPVDLPEHDSSA